MRLILTLYREGCTEGQKSQIKKGKGEKDGPIRIIIIIIVISSSSSSSSSSWYCWAIIIIVIIFVVFSFCIITVCTEIIII